MSEHTVREPDGGLLDTAMRHLADVGLDVTEVADDHLRITAPTGSEVYEVQLRSSVSPGSAAAIRSATHDRLLIVTAYVPESIAESWRRQDIYFVDTAGNMYLRGSGLLIDVRGHRRPAAARAVEPGRPLRMFKPSGLKVVFALLAEPDTVTISYRDIARLSGTSLGTVQWVLKELDEAGHLSSGPDGRQLHRVRELFNRWVEAYTLDLYPRLTLQRFDAPDPTWWATADEALRAEDAQWGGETAAHVLDRYLRPGRAVIYAPRVPRRLAIDHRFRKADGDGNVEIRERFWRFPAEASARTVPTPLIYADLIATAEPRQLDAAAHLREHDALLGRLDRG